MVLLVKLSEVVIVVVLIVFGSVSVVVISSSEGRLMKVFRKKC